MIFYLLRGSAPRSARCARLLGLAAIASFVACKNEAEPVAEGAVPYVATSLYPLQYFAERMLGEHVRVLCPLPEDADPLHWQPDRDALGIFAAARVLIFNGAGVEAWRATASLPASRIVDTTAGAEDQLLRFAATTHSHGGGEHTHEGVDGHTWLDPLLAEAQVEAMRDALAAAFPEHLALIQRNGAALLADLDDLDRRWRELAPRLARVHLIAAHPAYNYLAKRYGFEIKSLSLDPAEELDEGTFEALKIARGDREQSALLLWETPPIASTSNRLFEELDLPSIVFSPCENPSRADLEADLDFLAVMRRNLEDLASALPQ